MLIVLIFVQICLGNLGIGWNGENSLTLEDLGLLVYSHVIVTWVMGSLVCVQGNNTGLAS